MPYINHYSLHILDPDWGHLTIKISGHPPFPAQVMLNGHEYVARQARKAAIAFTKEGTCFTAIADAAGLAKVADTIRRMGHTRRYEPLLTGLRAMTALLVLRDKAIKPLLAAAQPLRPTRGAHSPKPIDLHYDAIQAAMKGVFHELGLAA